MKMMIPCKAVVLLGSSDPGASVNVQGPCEDSTNWLLFTAMDARTVSWSRVCCFDGRMPDDRRGDERITMR